MKLIVDSNVLFTFLWESSFFKKISVSQKLELISPEYALEEINRYSAQILEKTGISKEEFSKLKKELAIVVEFIPLEEYSSFLKEFRKLVEPQPQDRKKELLEDADFFALSLKMKCSIWTNDKQFKKQMFFSILSTKDVIDLLSEPKKKRKNSS